MRGIIETISSLANTSGGLMILGVNDNLEIVGFRRQKEDIARIIDDGIDPRPPYRIEETNYQNKRLLLVYLEKGTHPPYMSTRTKKAYGRRRANDYNLSSAEIRDRVMASTPRR
ncbi:MAG: ATP-binding protein [Thaumarchaeota archaeon]|nr:ATP-binding protein [Nitrososphaerota archaeon]